MADTPQTIVDAFVANSTGRAAAPKIVALPIGNSLVATSTEICGGPGALEDLGGAATAGEAAA